MRKGPFTYKGYSVYCFYQKISKSIRGYKKFGAIAKIKRGGKWIVFNVDGDTLDEVEREIKRKIDSRG